MLLPSLRHRPRPARQWGFSLLEVLVALSLVAVATMLALRSAERYPGIVVEDYAQAFARAIQAAEAEAVAQPGWMRLYIDVGGGRDSLGRAIALRVASGADTAAGTSADSTSWVSLSEGARFGTGAVTNGTGPMGDAIRAAVPTSSVRCDPARRCVFGQDSLSGWITFYIAHDDRPVNVRAVVLSSTGAVRIFRWRRGQWE